MNHIPFGTPTPPDYYGDDQPQDCADLEGYWHYVEQQLRERDQLHDTNQRKDDFEDV